MLHLNTRPLIHWLSSYSYSVGFYLVETMPYATTLISLVASFQIIVVFIMQMNLEYFITDG